MPFTPVHMGPGILLKTALGGRFSLTVFGWSQIVMDLQPLVVLATGKGYEHGYSHTYALGIVIALFSAISGKYAATLGLHLMGWSQFLPLTWLAAFTGAFIGVGSHVLLDSVMHYDIQPLAPLSSANGLLYILSIELLHGLCLLAGLIGAAMYITVCWYKREPLFFFHTRFYSIPSSPSHE